MAWGIGAYAVFAALIAVAIFRWVRDGRFPRLTVGWTVTLVLLLWHPGPGLYGLSSGLIAFLVMGYASIQAFLPRLIARSRQPRS